MSVTQETVRLLTSAEAEVKGRELAANIVRASRRIQTILALDGEISLKDATGILRECCPHLSREDARKIIKLTFNVK